MDEQKMTFESAMQRLDAIVRMLEQGDAPLEQSLTLFEEGANLLKLCNGMLDNAEQKIKILASDGEGGLKETDFKKSEG